MVQLEDADFAKLKKDADDNKQVVAIVRWIAFIIAFLFIFFCWGKPLLELDIQRRQVEIQCQMAIVKAKNNVEVREIESKGMELDDYIRWLNARETE